MARVLVVEDDPPIRRLVSAALRAEGLEVLPAADAQEALTRFVASDPPPEVAVLDLRLPGMDGRELARELRARDPGLRIVILSAYGAQSAAAEVGAELAFEKPFDPDRLARAVLGLAGAT